MKRMIRNLMGGMALAVLVTGNLWSQRIDEARMERDIEVAENVLGTLIKQQFDNQRMFFPLEIIGNYQPGFGVTFRIPADYTTPIVLNMTSPDNEVVVWGNRPSVAYSYSRSADREEKESRERESREKEKPEKEIKLRTKNETSLDSIRDAYNLKVIDAMKNFLVDYGDFLSQLPSNERILITNQGEQPRMWVGKIVGAPKRTHLSVEAQKADMVQFKEGKITRDQMLSKIKVINTEAVEAVEPDLELLSSIFNRLYRSDLSQSYFTDDHIYYERLKDFGAIYYMQVYSSVRSSGDLLRMPTIQSEDLTQEQRDSKVKELYPVFEKEMKENILEYGRTVKSLQDNEMLVFNVRLTACKNCGIPASVEFSVKASDLKNYAAAKADKNTSLTKINVKKGPAQ